MQSENDVAVSVSARVAQRTLTFEGTATVPDGARLAYEVKHESVPGGYGSKIPGFAEGSVAVEDGHFRKEIVLEDWPSGRVEVWVAFQTVLVEEEQPSAITERYGESGERITGSQVKGHPIRQVAAVAEVVI